MTDNLPLYFVGVCLPNESEPEQTLEVGILSWSERPNERPRVYVHTYLRPASVSRVRWSNAEMMNISRAFIESRQAQLPTISELIAAKPLQGRRVVCFAPGPQHEPLRALTAPAQQVYSLSERWEKVCSGDDDALRCYKYQQMLEFCGLQTYSQANHNYTPLLQQLHAYVALWELLTSQEQRKKPKSTKKLRSGLLEGSPLWPLPPTKPSLFESNPQALADIPDQELREFFNADIADHVDWYQYTIFDHDWLLHRAPPPDMSYLGDRVVMAQFLFNQVFSFDIQCNALMLYALYAKRWEHALEIALRHELSDNLPTAVREDFTDFLLRHLGEFLEPAQQQHLLRAIIRQGMEQRAAHAFEAYDYETLNRERNGAPDLVFHSENARGCPVTCFYEIHGQQGELLYRRYEISGSGREREACSSTVYDLFRRFLTEARNPLSRFWIDARVQAWVQFVTGLPWKDLKNLQRPTDTPQIREARSFLCEVINTESRGYLKALSRQLSEVITQLNEGDDKLELTRQFSFMGASVEIVVTGRRKLSWLKRLWGRRASG